MIESESRFSQKFIKTGNFFLILVPILSVIYFLWMKFGIPLIFYVSNYRTISYIGFFVLSAGYILTIYMTLFSQISVNSLQFSKTRIFGVVMFMFTMPLCCLSSAMSISLPIVLDKVEISNTTYYLTGELEILDSHTYHRLFKCNNYTYKCEQTPFWMGGGAIYQPLHLMVDEITEPKEIHVTWTSWDRQHTILDYTYGEQPRYYEPPAELNDHLYYLAYYRNPEPKSITFLLYECRLDNTFCKRLPIQYEGFGNYRDTTANEETEEINVFIDNEAGQDTLIFTWGENPRCYVQGCEILEGNK